MSVHAAAPSAATHLPHHGGHTPTTSSGDDGDDDTAKMKKILDDAQAQYLANFEMTEEQAKIDNNNSTFTTIASGHQQEAAGASASARTVGQGNAHIMA